MTFRHDCNVIVLPVLTLPPFLVIETRFFFL